MNKTKKYIMSQQSTGDSEVKEYTSHDEYPMSFTIKVVKRSGETLIITKTKSSNSLKTPMEWIESWMYQYKDTLNEEGFLTIIGDNMSVVLRSYDVDQISITHNK